MLEPLFQGILLGLGVAVPFGPLNILILSYALKSFKNAFATGLGAMSADILYLLLLLFGALKFLTNDTANKLIAILGFLFLSYMAFSMLKAKPKALEFSDKKAHESVVKSFIKGFGLNLFNPFIIGFWASVSLVFSQTQSPQMMVLGLFVAIFSWVFSLSFFVAKFAHKFTAKIVRIINIISAFIIEYFALLLLYKVFIANVL